MDNSIRKKKRSLHEATAPKGRKAKNIESKRNKENVKQLKGFYLNDRVRVYGQIGYMTGFTGTGMAYVKDIHGSYITKPNKLYKQVNLKDCEFLSHNIITGNMSRIFRLMPNRNSSPPYSLRSLRKGTSFGKLLNVVSFYK